MPQAPADLSPTRPIRFFHAGQVVAVQDLAPTTTVLTWLREQAHRTGTKEGCNEGDCGACTVIVASLSDDDSAIGGLRLEPINACTRFLPTLDGKALLTVEDLGPRQSGALHPVQQALVDCHGSQCGFCTPGFVMTMTAHYERHQNAGTQPSRQGWADALSGNLCRCTGYRPILDAGARAFTLPVQRLDTAPVVEALTTLRADPPLAFAARDVAFDQVRRFEAPRMLASLAALREADPTATLLSGGTDIALWVNKGLRDLGNIHYVGDVDALRAIRREQDHLVIGAGASLEDAWQALAQVVPALTEVWLRFASPPIRHAGTMGGNLANGSPIGDGAPALMALGAHLHLRLGARERDVPLDAFYLDYMKNRLEPGEFIQSIHVPLPDPGAQMRVDKLSKRFDSDISALCGALCLTLDGDIVRAVRLVFGGMAATVKRASHAEAALLGQVWTEATAHAAMAALAKDFEPLTDLRASADYRLRAARHLLLRWWHETRSDAPLARDRASVWSVR